MLSLRKAKTQLQLILHGRMDVMEREFSLHGRSKRGVIGFSCTPSIL